MPKGFTEEEKNTIKKNLIEKGTEYFGIYGLKKVNVEQITNAVGISKGSFYHFYRSKEEFFFDILKETEKKLIVEMQMLLGNMNQDPKSAIINFIKFHINAPKENPIIKQIADKKTREYLIRKIRNIPKIEQYLNTYDYLPLMIKNWQKMGYVIDKDPEVLAGILKALFTIGLDDALTEYIGKEKLPEIIDNLIEIITDYMIREAKSK
ncbi:MAG: TetR/AcrR family transcriptional regulator [Candidatus Lokiarchaeota archaeon]|nr:TetR/AcrR family transcriptional regulator [Candidatus Lokiarchaeota archaeon]